jgi:hypothetical protein
MVLISVLNKFRNTTPVLSTGQSLAERIKDKNRMIDRLHQLGFLSKEDSLILHAQEEVSSSMEELTASMQGISTASEETGKITKTLDEIAIQANLLIENRVKKVKSGTDIVVKTNEAFEKGFTGARTNTKGLGQ